MSYKLPHNLDRPCNIEKLKIELRNKYFARFNPYQLKILKLIKKVGKDV